MYYLFTQRMRKLSKIMSFFCLVKRRKNYVITVYDVYRALLRICLCSFIFFLFELKGYEREFSIFVILFASVCQIQRIRRWRKWVGVKLIFFLIIINIIISWLFTHDSHFLESFIHSFIFPPEDSKHIFRTQ
jgi:hypothetical protein